MKFDFLLTRNNNIDPNIELPQVGLAEPAAEPLQNAMLILLVVCEDASFLSRKVRVEWEGDSFAGLREKIAEKCAVEADSFDLEYPDADFNEYVDLDADSYKLLKDRTKLKIVQRKRRVNHDR